MRSEQSPRTYSQDPGMQREIEIIVASLPQRVRKAEAEGKPQLALYYRTQLPEFRPDIDPETLEPRTRQ